MQTETQKEAFQKLNDLYTQYQVKPKKYGFVEQSHTDSILYDTPGRLKDWKQYRRTTHIPIYKVKDESEGIKVD